MDGGLLCCAWARWQLLMKPRCESCSWRFATLQTNTWAAACVAAAGQKCDARSRNLLWLVSYKRKWIQNEMPALISVIAIPIDPILLISVWEYVCWYVEGADLEMWGHSICSLPALQWRVDSESRDSSDGWDTESLCSLIQDFHVRIFPTAATE